jgi:hypothetical protein
VLDRGKAKAAPMNMADSAAGKEEGKALKGKEKAPRPHPLLYGVLWVSASARRLLLGLPGGHFCEGRARTVCRGAAEESIRDRDAPKNTPAPSSRLRSLVGDAKLLLVAGELLVGLPSHPLEHLESRGLDVGVAPILGGHRIVGEAELVE